MNFCLWNGLGTSAPTDGLRDCEGEWEKNSSRWEQKNNLFALYLVFSPLWRCVALGAKGHLRWQKKREMDREKEGIILAAGLQNTCVSLAGIAQGLQLWKDKKGNAYHRFIALAFREDWNMSMKCFQCLVVQTDCLSGVSVVVKGPAVRLLPRLSTKQSPHLENRLAIISYSYLHAASAYACIWI